MNLADYFYLAAFAPAFIVTHTHAVRLSRAVEQTGRLQGRSTANLFSGCLALLTVIITIGLCRLIGIPFGIDEGAGAIDVALFGVIALPVTLSLSFVAATVVRHLPARQRRGPREGVNRWLARLPTGLNTLFFIFLALLLVVAVDAYVRQIRLGFGSFDTWDWAGFALVPAVLVAFVVYGRRARHKASSYSKRLRPASDSPGEDWPRVLYLRPFNEEHRLFAGSQTLDEYLDEEIAERIGPLIALGNPTDRIAPEGAARQYYEDDDWQAAVEGLATRSLCIVAVTSASPNTAWELKRVLELGLEERLYLLSPPVRESPNPPETAVDTTGRLGAGLRLGGRALVNWLAQDWDELSRGLSFGQLPSALSPAGQASWTEFVDTLVACGYSVEIPDPGAGAVIGFEAGGEAFLIEQGASSPQDYIQPIMHRQGLEEGHPEPGPPDTQPPM